MGQSPPSSTYNTVGEGKFFLQGKAECGAVYPTPTKWCSEPKKLAKEGSVLISVRAPVGNVNIAREAYCIGRGLAAINGRDSLDNWFLFYLLIFAKQRLEQKSTGSTFKSINKGVLRDFLIPLPPLPEQRRIAHVLSTIQEAIAAQEDLIAAARETKRSLMQRLFTYGPGVEPAATKETEFGQVPKPWKITLLEEIAFVQTGAAKGRNLGESRVMAVPYLRVANVQDGYLDLSEIKEMQVRVSELDRYRLQPGDVVLTEGGDFDKLGRGFIWSGQIPDCVHQNHIFAVRMNREILLPEYFAYLVQSDYAKGYFLRVAHRTTHLACINKTKLQSLPVLVPSLDEQGGVVSILNAADQKISTEEQRKAALEELFRSMLHQLMTGQVRVPASLEVRP
jgi:type I restriction enzyme S subunit